MPAYDSLNLIPDKQSVILDFGFKYTKFGFSGEPGPRFIIPTETVSTDKTIKVLQYRDENELRINLVNFIHTIFFKYALIHPKEKRIVIVESLLCTTVLRNTLASVLFDHFEASSVIFLPSHVVAMYTLGVNTGLVVDVGYNETVVIPVFEGVAVLKAWQALPLGSKIVETALRERLSNKVKSVDENGETSVNILTIPDSIIEDIKVKVCFVTNLERARLFSEGKNPEIRPLGLKYCIDGDKVIKIESDDRELPYEALFVQDGDQVSLTTMILDSILKCPLDMRKKLAENLVIIGGTAMSSGLKSRIKEELNDLMKTPKYSKSLFIEGFKFHNPPAKENYVAWLGGSICGATDLVTLKSITRDSYCEMNHQMPDWSSLTTRPNSLQIQKPLQL